jgi:serine/threonine protein kinase
MGEVVGGRYEVLGVLGEGAMGVVWRAWDQLLEREVALKELRPPQGVDVDEAVDRFLVEARAAARLSHPSIVTVHDVLADGERVLLAMELLEGPTLAEVVASGGVGAAARPVLVQVAGALAAAHGLGVVHRDLKPENVFWLPSGRVVVCDFGLARIGAGRGTRVGTVMGTPGYMAPEQIRGEEAGPAADVFAWGALAFELASGSPAFGDAAVEDAVTLSWRVVNEDPPQLVLEDDPGLVGLIGWALAKDPQDRPGDGMVLLEALQDGVTPPPPVAHSRRVSAPPRWTGPPTGSASAAPQRRRTGLIVAGVGGGVLLIGLIAVVALLLAGNSTSNNTVQFATQGTQPTPVSVTTITQPITTTLPAFSSVTSPSLLPRVSTEQMRHDAEAMLLDFHNSILAGDFSTAWSLLSARKQQNYDEDPDKGGFAGFQTAQGSLRPYLDPSSIHVDLLTEEPPDPSTGDAAVIVSGMRWSKPGAPCSQWSGVTWVHYENGSWHYDPGYGMTPDLYAQFPDLVQRRDKWKPRYQELLGVSCT